MDKYDQNEFFKAERKMQGALGSRYVSPIQITLGVIQCRFEEDVYRATLDAGIKVDKAELIKALNYDRAQYAQGYADGLAGRQPVVHTNADRIRAMSDEELAEFLDRWALGDIDYSKTFCDLCHGQYDCDECRLDWLRQEVTE